MNRIVSQRSKTVHEFFVQVDEKNQYIGAVLDEIRKQPGMGWVPSYTYGVRDGMAFEIVTDDGDFMLVKATIPDVGKIEADVEIVVEGGLIADRRVRNSQEIERRRGVRVTFDVVDHDVEYEEEEEDESETAD